MKKVLNFYTVSPSKILDFYFRYSGKKMLSHLQSGGRSLIKYIIFSVVLVFISGSLFALEINNYTDTVEGRYHNVTVAFDDLDKEGIVRCLIKKNGKPVGMDSKYIVGVGTITIHISGGVSDGTTASCEAIE